MTEFRHLLEHEIPRLRRYARALTRDPSRADDLVQSCLARALAKSDLWQPGTDLRAWLFTILHNQHVNDVRRAVREGINVPVDDLAPVLAAPSTEGASLALRDLDRAMNRLPEEQRQVLLLVGLEGHALRGGGAGAGRSDRDGAIAAFARARHAASADG